MPSFYATYFQVPEAIPAGHKGIKWVRHAERGEAARFIGFNIALLPSIVI